MASSGSGGELRVGVAVRPLAALVGSLRAVLEELEPGQLPARDAAEVVAVCDQLSRLADAGKTLAAGRVAASSLWSRGGHRSAAHWMAKVCGVAVGDAVRMLELAETVAEAPATKDALVAGKLSGRQAGVVGRAERADPAAGRRLVQSAPERSLGEVQADVRRIVAAASPETAEETAVRHRRLQRFWHGYDAEGMGIGGWRVPPAEQVRLVARHEAELNAVFEEKRRAGEREPVEVYAADAFIRMFDRRPAARTRTRRDGESLDDGSPDGGAVDAGSGAGGAVDGGSPDDGVVDEDWSFAKVIVKIDLTALDRGHTVPGEVSEVAGQGPVPVPDVWRMIDGDAFIAAVSTKGTEISKVVHLGRRPTVLQRTALEHRNGLVCSIEGCNSSARLEIDHVTDWAATRRTELDQLAFVCGHHHDLKTHHDHQFGPLMPNGKRRLIPPGEPEATSDIGPPDLVLHDGRPPPGADSRAGGTERGPGGTPPDGSRATKPTTPTAPTTSTSVEARARAIADRARHQGALFDTG
jgi:hypothetical protein